LDAAGNVSAASTAYSVTTTQDFSADSDHDGIPNATETALGTNGSAVANPDTSNLTQQNIHRPTCERRRQEGPILAVWRGTAFFAGFSLFLTATE
jgi:hypothetical protein